MKVLFDTNVILDALLERKDFVEDAKLLFQAVEKQKIEGFISATTVTDIHYIVFKQTKNSQIAIDAIKGLLQLMKVCAVDRQVLERAINLGLIDYEDAVQVASAESQNLNCIVTRNLKDVKGSHYLSFLRQVSVNK